MSAMRRLAPHCRAECRARFLVSQLKARYKGSSDVMLGLMARRPEFSGGNYVYGGENKTRSRPSGKYSTTVSRFPIVSSRTACPKTTWTAGRIDRFDRQEVAQLVGTTCSSPTVTRLADGIKNGRANSILSGNQIGTLTETLASWNAHKYGYTLACRTAP